MFEMNIPSVRPVEIRASEEEDDTDYVLPENGEFEMPEYFSWKPPLTI
jgi:hypothetical protein